MNERIEKLWDEAADSIAAIPNGRNNFWETQENFMEKFAELLVRECAGVCDDERDSTDSDFGKLVAEGCALKIMEHFGVEE